MVVSSQPCRIMCHKAVDEPQEELTERLLKKILYIPTCTPNDLISISENIDYIEYNL